MRRSSAGWFTGSSCENSCSRSFVTAGALSESNWGGKRQFSRMSRFVDCGNARRGAFDRGNHLRPNDDARAAGSQMLQRGWDTWRVPGAQKIRRHDGGRPRVAGLAVDIDDPAAASVTVDEVDRELKLLWRRCGQIENGNVQVISVNAKDRTLRQLGGEV